MKDEDAVIQLFENIVQLKLELSDAKNIMQIYLQKIFQIVLEYKNVKTNS